MNNSHDVEELLRDSLRRHADRAPQAGPVAERVLARVEVRPARPRRRPWLLPVAAAAVVVVTSVAVAAVHQRSTTPPVAPIGSAASQASTAGQTAPTAAPSPTPGAVSDTTEQTSTREALRPLAIHMVTATAGWALADAGLLHTDDGGATWTVRTPPKLDARGSPDVTGIDIEGDAAFSGPAEMWFAVSGAQVVTVFHTTDAGLSWSFASIPAPTAAGGSGGMISAVGMSFPTTKDGWLLANVNSFGATLNAEQVALYRTDDGGATWAQADAAMRGKDSPSGLTEHGLKTGIGFATAEHGWITGYVGGDTTPWMYRTADGAGTWTRLSLPAPQEDLVDASTVTDPPHFFDEQQGVFPLSWPTTDGGSVTTFHVTHDGGGTWQSAAPLTWNGGPWLAAWPDAAHAAVVNGLDWCTTATSGASWQCDPLPAELEGVTELSFATAQLGWAVADGGLYRTTDGGGTWSPVDARLAR